MNLKFRDVLRGVRLPVVLTALVGASLSVLGCLAIRRAEHDRAYAKAQAVSEDRVKSLRRELDLRLVRLNALAGFFAGSNDVTAGEFARFVAVSTGGPEPGFTLNWVPAGRTSDFKILYSWPAGAIAASNGALARDARVAAALRQAQAAGSPVVAAGVFSELAAGPPALLAVAPVYAGAPGKSRLAGHVAASFRVGELLESGLRYLSPGGVDVAVYDRDAPPGGGPLYFHASRMGGRRTAPQQRPDMRFRFDFEAAGRRWRAECDATPQYVRNAYSGQAWMVLALGLAVTALAARWLNAQMGHSARVEALVAHRTRELAAARDEAVRASTLKSQFLANVSHELRTPLNGVIGMAGLLLETRLEPEQRHFAEVSARSAETLLVVVNDLLDMSRMESGKLIVEPGPVRVAALAAEAVAAIGPAARAKGLRVGLETAPGAPELALADGARIRQALLNLLGNAVKFTAAGRVDTVVETTREGSGWRARFTVRDTGPGVPAEAREIIFRRFAQLDGAASRKEGGLGLGLPIVRQLAHLMGGDAGLESVPGQGSSFWFTVRLEECAPVEAPAPVSHSPAGRVLLAEDNPVNRTVAARMLARLGYAVECAENGAAAVEAARGGGFHAILMDCQMPVMDGYEATARIRALPGERSRVRIIALTANAMAGDRERCLSAGMDDYVTKPIRAEALRVAIGAGS